MKTISRAAGLAVLVLTAPAWGQGAVQPSNPPAPQQGINNTGPTATTTSGASPEETKPIGTTATSPDAAAGSGVSHGGAAKLNATDKGFVQKATVGGLAEIQEGQLATEQAKSPDVKAFGQHMVSDHTAAGQKLKSILDGESISAPSAPDATAKKQIAALQKAKGDAFDRQYLKDQLAAHKQTVALFKKEAASGGDPQLKQFASDTLPALEQHLSAVQGLTKR